MVLIQTVGLPLTFAIQHGRESITVHINNFHGKKPPYIELFSFLFINNYSDILKKFTYSYYTKSNVK